MQTFLPYPDFVESLQCLDYRRLGKQRVEAFQLLKSIRWTWLSSGRISDPSQFPVDLSDLEVVPNSGWLNHPAREMWIDHPGALAVYHDVSIAVWVARGYNNTMLPRALPGPHPLPKWFGREDFHASHRSNLLRKLPSHYSTFGWIESDDLPYIWPTKE